MSGHVQSLEQIPKSQLVLLRQNLSHEFLALSRQIEGMSDSQLVVYANPPIVYRVAEAIRNAAYSIGYLIALPVAFAARVVTNIVTGLADGIESAFRDLGF